jgi:lactate 2-monooxygenase
MAANRQAFQRWKLLPRMLRGNQARDISVNLFGTEYPTPVIQAPVGVNKIWHDDGEIGVARACHEVGVPYTISTASSTSIEDIAAAVPQGKRWFQLYWPQKKNSDVTLSMLARAKKAGCEVLLVTLDLWALGWRPTDLDQAYVPFFTGTGVQIGFTDPVWRKKYEEETGKTVEEDIRAASMAWLSVAFSGEAHSWEELKFLKDNWDGPMVLKGIQTVEDAEKAVEVGADGILVSNHG